MYQFKTNLFESEQVKRLAPKIGWRYSQKTGEAKKGTRVIKKIKNDKGDNKFRLFSGGRKVKDFDYDEEVIDHLN
jgi:hypothetical protein